VRVKIIRSGSGAEHVYLQEPYRDEQGRPRHRIVEKLGKLTDLQAQNPQALDQLRERAKQMTTERASRKGMVAYDTAQRSDRALAANTGWLLVEAAWKALGLDAYLRRQTRSSGWEIDVEAVARLLVAQRIIRPGSKKAAVESAGGLFGATEVDLGQAYRALDHLSDLALKIQAKAHRAAGPKSVGPMVFYDVTNYFFATDQPDRDPVGEKARRGQASRQDGYSKERRLSPIIQMGLFLDDDAIPIAYRLFDGCVPDVRTLQNALAEFKASFTQSQVTVVADKAMNTKENTGMLAAAGDGWIFSASVRSATTSLKRWATDPAGWTPLGADGTPLPKHQDTHDRQDNDKAPARIKSKTITRTVHHVQPDGSVEKINVTEKVIARWSAAHAARDAHTRTEMLDKARVLATDPAKYKASNRKGVKKYIRNETVDPDTGELEDPITHLSVDEDLAHADARFDGLWLIHTSLTGTPDLDILNHYHQLWKIENTFKVTKTDLKARPVYVWSPTHIEAHFLICFLALLITRLLQRWTGLDAPQLIDTLRATTARHAGEGVYLLDRPTQWDTIDQATATPLDQKWATITELRAWRRDLTTAARDNLFPT